MLLIPLGLGEKRPRLPWVTLTIAALCVLVSIAYFPTVNRISTLHQESLKDPSHLDAAQAFVNDYAQVYPNKVDGSLVNDLLAIHLGPKKDQTKLYRERLKTAAKGEGRLPASLIANSASLAQTLLIDPARVKEASDFETLQNLKSLRYELEEPLRVAEAEAEMLTKKNRSPVAIALAQWTHGGWMHLIGNLCALLAFGMAVEYRLRKSSLLTLYFVGGTFGLLAETVLLKSSSVFVLGASANIAALMGAFFILFYHRNMKFLFSFVVYNKVIQIPVKIIVPVMFVLGDLAGAAALSSSVAHLAHLTGFVVGAFIAWICLLTDSLGTHFLSHEEQNLCHQLTSLTSMNQKIQTAQEVMALNTSNDLAVLSVLTSASQVKDLSEPGVWLSLTSFLQTHLGGVVDRAVQKKDVRALETCLRDLTLDFSLPILLSGCDPVKLDAIAQRELKKGDWLLAVRLFDAISARTRGTPLAEKSEATVRNVFAHLQKTNADLSVLFEYQTKQRETSFGALLNDVTSQLGVSNVIAG